MRVYVPYEYLQDNLNLHIKPAVHLQNAKKEYKHSKKKEMQDIFNKRNKTKSVFQHDMVYEDFKDLPTRTVSDKVLCDNALMLKIQNMVIKEILLQ